MVVSGFVKSYLRRAKSFLERLKQNACDETSAKQNVKGGTWDRKLEWAKGCMCERFVISYGNLDTITLEDICPISNFREFHMWLADFGSFVELSSEEVYILKLIMTVWWSLAKYFCCSNANEQYTDLERYNIHFCLCKQNFVYVNISKVS